MGVLGKAHPGPNSWLPVLTPVEAVNKYKLKFSRR